uniref:Putative conserved plasma membrane protein n=1 Tax=Xenopsylla cheopis TaxID=163159 RepID=A0A6M2DC63_XENCH
MNSVTLTRRCALFGWKHITKTKSNYNIYTKQRQQLRFNQIFDSQITYTRTYTTRKDSNNVNVTPLIKTDKDDEPTDKDKEKDVKDDGTKKVGLFKKFKQMYRDYWYVLIPVHVVTSTCWAGLFYYTAKSGVDVIAVLESIKVSPAIIENIRDSNMGYIALTYALYKIATPARYAVTLAGTTISINYLKRWGYLRPVPSREKLKDMYKERKDALHEKYQERKEGIQEIYQAKREVLKSKKRNLWEDIVKRNQSDK